MASESYTFSFKKSENLTGLSENSTAFRRKELYFRVRALFATDPKEVQQFLEIARLIKIARGYSACHVFTNLVASPGNADELTLFLKFYFPNLGVLYEFLSGVRNYE